MGYKRKEYENMENLFTNGKKKFVKYEEGAAMYSMGIHAFTELAKEAKAIYRIRRIVLVNTEIIDEHWRTCEMCNGVMGQCKKKQRIEKAR